MFEGINFSLLRLFRNLTICSLTTFDPHLKQYGFPSIIAYILVDPHTMHLDLSELIGVYLYLRLNSGYVRYFRIFKHYLVAVVR